MTIIPPQRLPSSSLLELADRLDGTARETVIDLAGKWKHGWIPLDAIAAAIKAKQMRGDGVRRPRAEWGTAAHSTSGRGKTRLDPKGAAQHAALTSGARGKARPPARAAAVKPDVQAAARDAVRAKRPELERRAAKGDRVAQAELDRRQLKRDAKRNTRVADQAGRSHVYEQEAAEARRSSSIARTQSQHEDAVDAHEAAARAADSAGYDDRAAEHRQAAAHHADKAAELEDATDAPPMSEAKLNEVRKLDALPPAALRSEKGHEAARQHETNIARLEQQGAHADYSGMTHAASNPLEERIAAAKRRNAALPDGYVKSTDAQIEQQYRRANDGGVAADRLEATNAAQFGHSLEHFDTATLESLKSTHGGKVSDAATRELERRAGKGPDPAAAARALSDSELAAKIPNVKRGTPEGDAIVAEGMRRVRVRSSSAAEARGEAPSAPPAASSEADRVGNLTHRQLAEELHRSKPGTATHELLREEGLRRLRQAEHPSVAHEGPAPAPAPPVHAPGPAPAPSRRKPSRTYLEYQAAKQEQERRFENQGRNSRQTTLERSDYFGTGENMGRGRVEEPLTYRKWLEDRKADPQQQHEAQSYDAGLQLGKKHAAEAAARKDTAGHNAEYDRAASGLSDESFAGGYSDGILAHERIMANRAAGRAKATETRKARTSSQVIGTLSHHDEMVTVHSTPRGHRVKIDGRNHGPAHPSREAALAEAHTLVPEHRRASTEDAARAQAKKIRDDAEKARREKVAERGAGGSYKEQQAAGAAAYTAAHADELKGKLAAEPTRTYVGQTLPDSEIGHGDLTKHTDRDLLIARENASMFPERQQRIQAEINRRYAEKAAATPAPAEQHMPDTEARAIARMGTAKDRANAPGPHGEKRGDVVTLHNDGVSGDRQAVYLGRNINGDPEYRGPVNGQMSTSAIPPGSYHKITPGRPAAAPRNPDAVRLERNQSIVLTGPNAGQVRENPTSSDRIVSGGHHVGDHVSTEYGPGRVVASTDRSISVQLDSGETINVQRGTPGFGRVKAAAPKAAAAEAAAPAGIRVEHSGDGTVVYGTERGDKQATDALKANGFKWSRSLGGWYLPRTWGHSTRSQRVDNLERALGGKVTVDRGAIARSGSGADRAQAAADRAREIADQQRARAERFRAESEAHDAAARRISDGIPMGQPILVGHHSERRHRRDIERIQNNTRKSFEAHNAAQGAEQRAASAEARARMQADPAAAARRLDRAEAELRAVERRLNGTGKQIHGEHVAATGDYAERLRARRQELVQQIEHDRGIAGNRVGPEARYGKHNVSPGDVVNIRGRNHIVHSTGPKNVKVMTEVGPLPYPYSQLQAHGSMESTSTETLKKWLQNARRLSGPDTHLSRRTSPAMIARAEKILRDRGETP